MVLWTRLRRLASSSTIKTVCRLRMPLRQMRLNPIPPDALVSQLSRPYTSDTPAGSVSLPAKSGHPPMQSGGFDLVMQLRAPAATGLQGINTLRIEGRRAVSAHGDFATLWA